MKIKTVMHKISISTLIVAQLVFLSACSQETKQETSSFNQKTEVSKPVTSEPHRYGGWYCPDNFGFEPVNILDLDKVPAIADRLPTEEELQNHKSLIKIDKVKYPNARALPMDLPRVARVYQPQSGLEELIIVIQAVVVQEDTVVGYRFANGGNGSARIGDVAFLSDDEVAELGSQPFYYQRLEVPASTKQIWTALQQSDYFAELATKFNQQQFFNADWNPEAETSLKLTSETETANGFAGMVYGNFYLHVDYMRDGIHYSEKMLISENPDGKPTEIYFASGPYPTDFTNQQAKQNAWLAEVERLCNGK